MAGGFPRSTLATVNAMAPVRSTIMPKLSARVRSPEVCSMDGADSGPIIMITKMNRMTTAPA